MNRLNEMTLWELEFLVSTGAIEPISINDGKVEEQE